MWIFFVKIFSEWTFHIVKIRCWSEGLADDTRKFYSTWIFWTWVALFCQWKCILSLSSVLLARWATFEKQILKWAVFKQKPLGIISW
jgi:hypothetical protein